MSDLQLKPARRHARPLFETHWRARPVRAFVSTLRGLVQPWRLWPDVERSQPPRIAPLLMLLVLLWFLVGLVEELLREYERISFSWVYYAIEGDPEILYMPTWRLFIDYGFFESVHWTRLSAWTAVLVWLWLCGCAASGAVRRRPFSDRELLRVSAYSLATLMLFHAVFESIFTLLTPLDTWLMVSRSPVYGGWMNWYYGFHRWNGPAACALALLTFVWGCAVALRMGRTAVPWCAVVVTLFTGTAVLLLRSFSINVYGTLDTRWIIWIEREWWPGIKTWLVAF